ncbi:plasmid pRiA4b ORF-3 family protein [Arthrobacter castelli]|uniref:plasmid pRiA4b ORF-3 family protein n=1 Tax=Arthrobacter castelli TaxID=271431 RepID=UPI00138B1529|nr:plasmid pRiA4b ORF-3 family protein [Arthrobacter castelli]
MGDAGKSLDLSITIVGTEPEIRCDLRVPASAALSDLHRAIQRAFGWEDRHLHAFTVTDPTGRRRSFTTDEETVMELQMEFDTAVAIGDITDGPGSVVSYEYDFGDGWDHQITVTGDAVAPAGQFSCLDGANRGPVEDSGGIGGYRQLCEILADVTHPQYRQMADWYTFVTGHSAFSFDPSEFDIEQVNGKLERLSLQVNGAKPTPEEISAVVRPARWLLQRVGTEGLELTKDGYLKPAVVAEIMSGLGWERQWPGKHNRETQTLPVWELRTRMQQWKLLRKYKGKLLRTPAARKIADDDAALWDHLASAVATEKHPAVEATSRVVVAWLLADQLPPWRSVGDAVAQVLMAEGFGSPDGGPVSEAAGLDLFHAVRGGLVSLGVFGPECGVLAPRVPSPGGLKFLMDVRRHQHVGGSDG